MATMMVTGAGRGIGLELTAQLLARGDHVVATYRDGESRRRLEAVPAHGKLTLCRLDVRDDAVGEPLAAALEGAPVDVLINNAGVMVEDASLDALDYDGWLDTMHVNVLGPVRITVALLPNLRASTRPRVVTLSSIMGALHRESSTGHYAYRSSKAAVNKAMRLLANDLAPDGIVVVPVHPGWVRTDMGGSEAALSAEESARGLITLIDGLEMEQSGRFWQWDGSELDW